MLVGFMNTILKCPRWCNVWPRGPWPGVSPTQQGSSEGRKYGEFTRGKFTQRQASVSSLSPGVAEKHNPVTLFLGVIFMWIPKLQNTKKKSQLSTHSFNSLTTWQAQNLQHLGAQSAFHSIGYCLLLVLSLFPGKPFWRLEWEDKNCSYNSERSIMHVPFSLLCVFSACLN